MKSNLRAATVDVLAIVTAWGAADPRLQRYPGYHVIGSDLSGYVDNVRGALAYLKRQRAARRAAGRHRYGRTHSL